MLGRVYSRGGGGRSRTEEGGLDLCGSTRPCGVGIEAWTYVVVHGHVVLISTHSRLF